ncbi:MAG: peroxiredoxin [Acidobacteriota bacterium]|nr:peroxiredoxin [Acidobacteriota bacterium]
MSMPTPGDRAPEFELKDQDGSIVRLRDLTAQGPVVLFFYPKDDTTGCTKEACRFRDDYAKFRDAGARVFGVSSDSESSHRDFASKYSLPYPLLSDPGGKVRKLYGATGLFGLLPGRVTFVIGRDGVIRRVYSSQTNFERHAGEALAAVAMP